MNEAGVLLDSGAASDKHTVSGDAPARIFSLSPELFLPELVPFELPHVGEAETRRILRHERSVRQPELADDEGLVHDAAVLVQAAVWFLVDVVRDHVSIACRQLDQTSIDVAIEAATQVELFRRDLLDCIAAGAENLLWKNFD